MAAFPGRLPAFRLPRMAVRGSARVHAFLGMAGMFLALLLIYYVFASHPAPPVSTVTNTPALDPKPGNANNSDYMRGLAIDKAHRDADAAKAAGQTTTPDMRAAEVFAERAAAGGRGHAFADCADAGRHHLRRGPGRQDEAAGRQNPQHDRGSQLPRQDHRDRPGR